MQRTNSRCILFATSDQSLQLIVAFDRCKKICNEHPVVANRTGRCIYATTICNDQLVVANMKRNDRKIDTAEICEQLFKDVFGIEDVAFIDFSKIPKCSHLKIQTTFPSTTATTKISTSSTTFTPTTASTIVTKSEHSATENLTPTTSPTIYRTWHEGKLHEEIK